MPGHHFVRLAFCVLCIAVVTSPYADTARAQETVPPRTDLAALALRPGDVPEAGWKHAGAFMEDLASQAEVVAGYRGDGSTAAEVTEQLFEFGWQRMYLNVLHGPPGTVATPTADASSAPARRIRSYLAAYASAEGAADGFAYLEDESGIASAEDVPGTRQFGEQSEVTADEGTSGIDGRPFRSLDLTFRMGNIVAGVTAIAYGSGAALPDTAELEALAAVLETRLREAPESAGLGPVIARFGGDRHEIATYDDAYYRIAGEDIPIIDESLTTAARRIASYAGATDVYQLWQGIDVGTAGGVLYGVTALRFPEEAAAAAWMNDLATTLGENPFYGSLRTLVLPADLSYPAVALSYVSGGGSPDAPRAVLVAVQAGPVVARVHVVPQGGMRDVPLSAVLSLAEVQAACLGGVDCDELTELPPDLIGPEPAASPVPAG